jgi:ubiquinone/menaquinone biosynthesis C-methylase UbiE
MSGSLDLPSSRAEGDIPDYLQAHYWWAYIHPRAVRVFDRGWLVNLILWGNYRRLTDAALHALGDTLTGRCLQMACVYGDLTPRLARQVMAGGGSLDVIDVLPMQLANLRHKLRPGSPVRLLRQDSTALAAADASYDRVLLFFLLHEQPADVRRRTLNEALRVVKPGGRVVVVDYARPRWWHPLRWLWLPVLHRLEPYARALWNDTAATWLPSSDRAGAVSRIALFGGLYQLVTIVR